MTIIIKTATKSDIPEISELHVIGWQTSGEGVVDPRYLSDLKASDRVSEWEKHFQEDELDVLLAFEGEECVGFVNYGPLRTAPPGMSKIRPAYSSEIYAIYLNPKYFRQGVGTKLFKEAIKHLREKKHQSVCLWVLKGNKRACAFYDKFGGQRIGKKDVEIGPTKTKDICYGWRDISVISDA